MVATATIQILSELSVARNYGWFRFVAKAIAVSFARTSVAGVTVK